MLKRGLLLIAICWGLLACQAVTPAAVQVDSWQAHQQKLQQMYSWNIEGKFSFHHDKTTIGSFQWQQAPKRYTLQLAGPMHVGSAKLEGGEGKVLLLQADRVPLEGASPEALLQRQLGWHVPVSPLRYWIVGALVPNQKASVRWDSRHHLRFIRQMGWEVALSDYHEEAGVFLPRRLFLRRNGLWVKLVVQSWHWSRDGG